MKSEIYCQCFICKKKIDPIENELDPCSIYISTNINKELCDQKSQTFFCHYECFKNVNNDDSTLYLEALETKREMDEENERITENITDFSQLLYERAIEKDIWRVLFRNSVGKWISLRSILNNDNVLLNALDLLEESLYEPLIVTWTEDAFSEQRSTNCIWKLVLIATESHYEFPKTLLISLDKDYFEKG